MSSSIWSYKDERLIKGSLFLKNTFVDIFIAPACSRVRYRHPIFCPSVLLSTFMCDIGARLSIHLSVRPSLCPSVNSSVMSKFDIYVKVSILINYKTKQPSNLVWNISVTSWLCDIGACFSICLSVHPSVCLLTFLLCQSSTFTSKLVF